MKPLHIDPNCPECGTALQPSDLLDNPDTENPFIDQWACPKCYDGHSIYMDWDQSKLDDLASRAQEAKDHPERMIPWEEVRKDLFSDLSEEEREKYFKESEERAKNMTEEEIAEFTSKIKRIINV